MPFWRFVALVSARYGWRVAKRHLGHPTMELGPGPDDVDEAWDFVARIMDADLLEQLTHGSRLDDHLALARTLAGHLWNGVLAIAVGSAIAAWGVVTRVRWRAGFGAVAVVLATVLLIGVPLSRSVTWTGLSLWITLCVIGVTAIVVATTLER